MKARKRQLATALIAVTLLTQSFAHANVGTPLMWAGMFHLLFGNAVIGVIEGLLIARLFRTRKSSSVALMVAANYVSMIAGAVLLVPLGNYWSHSRASAAPLYDAPKILWLLAIASFVTSIVLELPFCFFALSRGKYRGRTSLHASIVAQAASYALLVPYYLLASGISLYTRTHVDRSLSFASKSPATVYFIGQKDGDVYQIQLSGSGRRKVLTSNITSRNARLFVRRAKDSQKWSLWVKGYPRDDAETLLIKDFATHAAPSWRGAKHNKEEGTWFSFGSASDLRPEQQRTWRFWTDFWAADGLQAYNKKTEERLHIALETPFIQWFARNATVLPGDQVVFQLDEQIVLFDLSTRKIGLVTMGRGPIVVLEDEQEPAP